MRLRFITSSVFIIIFFTTTISQTNEWVMYKDATVGNRAHYAVNFIPSLNKFILNLGTYGQVKEHPYPDLIFDESKKRWLNYVPDSLYGLWADSIGNTLLPGLFNGYYFEFKENKGHLIPQLIHNRQAAIHRQFALNTKDNKVYYYLNKITFSYDPINKEYEVYNPDIHPTGIIGRSGTLKWGMMCYDPINDEIILIGGGSINAKDGHPGFWSFNTNTKQWKQNNNQILPGPRAYSNMVYDSKQKKILLFGGDHLDYLHSDTWEYNCLTKKWKQLSPKNSPSPRGGHMMLYSAKSEKVFLIGGYHYTSNTDYLSPLYWNLKHLDLWTYNWGNETWEFIKEFDYSNENTPRPARSKPHYFTGCIDYNDNLLVLGDGSSQYRYIPKTYQITLDLTIVDTANTRIQGVPQGTIEQRKGPYSPEYFADNPVTLEKDFYENLPLDKWVRIPVGENRYPRSNRDWGTTVFDPDRNQFYKWAGGHSAHCGTDVPIYSPSTSQWRLGYSPEFPLEYTYANGANPGYFTFNNRPFMSVHTYDSYDYDINLRKMVAIGSGHTYIFDPEKEDWIEERIPLPKGVKFSPYHTSISATKHGVVLWITNLKAQNNSSLLFLLNSITKQWDLIDYQGPKIKNSYCDQAGTIYDSKRDRMLFATYDRKLKSTSLFSYHFATNTSKLITPKNEGLASGSDHFRESVYIPSLDIVLYQINKGISSKLIYSCADNKWDTLVIKNQGYVKTTNTRSSGYMYDAKRNIIYDCEANCDVYALRLSGSFPTDTITHVSKIGDFENNIAIYPNPSTNLINILFNKIHQKVTVELYSNSGRLIFNKVYKDQKQIIIPLHVITTISGHYSLKIITDDQLYTEQIQFIQR